MTKYRVYIETVASAVVEVDASNQEEAIDAALENAPSANHTWPDIGDWYFPADEDYQIAGVPPRRPEDYIEEIN